MLQLLERVHTATCVNLKGTGKAIAVDCGLPLDGDSQATAA